MQRPGHTLNVHYHGQIFLNMIMQNCSKKQYQDHAAILFSDVYI